MAIVSIIVPIYNKQNCLEKCVSSILAQTYKDIEVILVDDGSTDKSWELCLKLAQKDKRIKTIHKENGGVSSARNSGIANAKGKYIQFVDSDDYITPIMTEHLLCAMETQDVELVICGYTQVESDKETCFLPNKMEKGNIRELGESVSGLFEEFYIYSPWNKLYLKEKIKEGFPEDLSLGEDLTFNLSYIENIKFVSVLNESHYYYVVGSDNTSLSRKKRSDILEIKEKLFENSLEFCDRYMPFQKLVTDISNTYMVNVIYTLCAIYNAPKLKRKEKRTVIKRWINKQSVVLASRNCCFKTLQRKISAIFIRRKWVLSLELLFLMKGKTL